MKEWEKNIRKVVPYVPGEQPKQKNIIKLNTNENPYPPAKGVLEAQTNLNNLRFYPDPVAADLVNAIADYHHLDSSRVFVGVGSDDVLAMSFLTFFNSDKPIYFPDITYSFYDVWADLFRIPYETKALNDNFELIASDYYDKNGGVVFPNPNAPTGILKDLSFVRDVLEHNQDVIVIVDEAYIDFAGESALSLLDKYDNLIITQTFSKARSMAGMRIGYAIASPLLIKYLNDAKYSFNSYTMNKTSLVYGAEAVKDKEYFAETTRKIVETRDWAEEEFKKLGFVFPKPSANFIFVSHPEYDAKELFEAMKAKGIYVRFWGSERIEQYLRVTIGTREEMEELFAFLREYMM